jgi:putative endonuclease
VYIVEAQNGMLYTGITNDLHRRMDEHKSGRGAKFFKQYGFGKLVYYDEVESKSAAMRIEKSLKSLSRGEKIFIINEASDGEDVFKNGRSLPTS